MGAACVCVVFLKVPCVDRFERRHFCVRRLQRYGGIWPITESSTGSPVERVTIAGYTWELFTGWNGAMRVYSFLPPSGTSYNSFSADVKLFFDYLGQKYAFPASEQYMLSKSLAFVLFCVL